MKIRENVYSVRAVDGEIRVFHGYRTPVGTTYNAYLVLDGETTLVDSVKPPFAGGFMEHLKEILGDGKIDNFICNHTEPDHSGALPALAAAYPEMKILGTANCKKGLDAYYPGVAKRFTTVKKGDSLTTGRYTFRFYPVPMIHWPDSMTTYLEQERILFSNDAFGQHIGTGETFDREIPSGGLLERAGDYYANIVMPYGIQVASALATLSELDIATVCPSHGLIVERYLPQVLDGYSRWCRNQTDPDRAVIIFDTMWGATRKLAQRLGDEFGGAGISYEIIDLSEKHISYAMARLLEARHVCVGSPTLNNRMMPTVSAFVSYMCGLKPKNRIGRAFGAYGWSGESVGLIDDALKNLGFETAEPVKVMWNA